VVEEIPTVMATPEPLVAETTPHQTTQNDETPHENHLSVDLGHNAAQEEAKTKDATTRKRRICDLWILLGSVLALLVIALGVGVGVWSAMRSSENAASLIGSSETTKKVETMNVFVTRTNYNGNLGGIKGADQKCNLAAANAGLEGTYKAWIATSPLDDAESRFVGADKPYTTVNGDVLAENFEDFIDGSLLQSNYFYDEYGNAIGPEEGGVATPLRENGTYYESRAETCYGYTSATSSVRSNFIAGRTDGGLDLNTAVQCNFGKMKLLCVEQGEE